MRFKFEIGWLVVVALGLMFQAAAMGVEPGLVGHWKLQGDCRDYSGQGNHGVNHGVKLDTGQFDGVGSYIEVPASDSLKLGTRDFALCAWVHTEKQIDDIVGDVVDLYEPAMRRGITLSINSAAGSLQSTGTDRRVYFGIDNAKLSDWEDCGRPSAASNYVSLSMTAYKGKLYAATTGGRDEKDWRHVYRYDHGQDWFDCGQVGDEKAQGVGPLIVHNGNLYAVTWTVDWTRVKEGGYDPGRVHRYLGGTKWEDCGQPSDNQTLNCIASYRGKLYVGGGWKTFGVFTQAEDKQWAPSKVFAKEGPRRCFPHTMAVFNGKLFTGYPVAYALDGREWTYVGKPTDYPVDGLQLYCFTPHQGKLCVGTWPEGKVAVYQGGEDWQEIGRMGEDGTEPNGLIVYNGKLYGGTLPRGEVCRYDGDSKWTSLKRFFSPEGWDPGVPYSKKLTRKQVNEWVRLTSLTIHDGKLFASTGSCTSSVDDAPCDIRGKVFSMEAGKCVSYDDDIGAGWKHLVAMREGGRLKVFVDGKLVAQSSSFDPAEYDVSTDRPLRIGFGQIDYFNGKIADVRVYNRALTDAQIQQLSAKEPTAANNRLANIVVAANASRLDKFAAAELKRCLAAALGWKATVSEDKSPPSGGPVFFVGSLDSGITRAADFPALEQNVAASLQEDGVCLKGDGHRVALVGKGARGGLNAVYEFLEKKVGIHWPEPGREHIPNLDSLNLQFGDVHNPAFCYRGLSLVRSPNLDAPFHAQIIDWVAKNRLNTFQFSCETYELLRPALLDTILDRGTTMKIGGHSREFFYPGEKYFAANPDHFALVKGQRTGQTQLCYSNHASVAEFVANIVAYLKTRPEIGMVGLWPSDGYGFCECERCKAGATTDILLDYINDASERIRAELPHMKVEFLSYIHYTVPPAKSKPLPHVVPTYCEYWSRNQFHPITDDRLGNAKCREQLESWVKASNQATVYSYYADDSMKRFLYNPVSDVILADLQYYKSIGAAGSTVLMMTPQRWWANAQHMYAYAKGSWDTSVSLADVDDAYFRSMYGPAAMAMQAHQQAARKMFDADFGHGQTGEEMLFSFKIKKFNPANEESSKQEFQDRVRQIRDCLAAAKAVSTEPAVVRRIEILDQNAQLMGQIFGILNEAAGYKADRAEARKDRTRTLIESVLTNEVAVKEDFRGKVLKSLLPQVAAVLGPEEAAKYDRSFDVPPE